MEFKTKLLPEDLVDIFIGLMVVPIQILILIVMPATIVALSLRPLLGAYSGVAGELTGVLACVLFLLFSVQKVTIAKDAVVFHRVMGFPKRIEKAQFKGYEVARARDVVLFGWLWPIFPPREASFACSVRGHVKIYFDGGYVYFPPRDLDAFIEHLDGLKS